MTDKATKPDGKKNKVAAEQNKANGEKNKVTVEIFGSSYALRGSSNQEKITSLAVMINDRMKKTAKENPRLSDLKIAVLVALNIAEEHMLLKEDYDTLMEMIKEEKI